MIVLNVLVVYIEYSEVVPDIWVRLCLSGYHKWRAEVKNLVGMNKSPVSSPFGPALSGVKN